MELKIAGAVPADLARKMSELRIFGTSFSKYGTAYLDMMETMREKESSAALRLPTPETRRRPAASEAGRAVAMA